LHQDINNILNAGDVPNLYGPEEMDQIMTACRADCQKKRIVPTKLNIFAQYIIRVRRNIHVVMCMSPLGEAFRDRLRMFPSLVNCCTIDWFTEWPAEALRSVAMAAMRQQDLGLDEHLENVVSMFQAIHQAVEKRSVEFYEVHIPYPISLEFQTFSF
jgi:dynein heavy chain, axonemal